MSDWREVEVGHERIRYRDNPAYRTESGFRFELERWHEGRREWRGVRNWSSRDWFAIGWVAGQSAPVQEEMKL